MKDSAPSYETGELREFGEVLRGRRTINFYVQTPVPKKLVRAAIEAATWAPNHHVTEPWRFICSGRKRSVRAWNWCATSLQPGKMRKLVNSRRTPGLKNQDGCL